jgi:acetylornithine deacetylase/succinyl-diaminopimelate desuccinylase-like protein
MMEAMGEPAARTIPGALMRAWDQIDSDFDAHVERIRSYLRQPTVAATGEGVEAGAELTAALVENAGGSAEIVPTPGSPVVLGHIDGTGPSVVRYGMYDVQPADEPDWSSPPFAAEIHSVNGVGPAIVARGAANSKSALAAFFLALESLRRVDDIPVGVELLLDGEEEAGSPSLGDVIEAHRDRLGGEAAFDLDLTAESNGTPVVSLGCKGIVSLRLVCSGGDWGGPVERAQHSSEGVIVASPAWSLVRALGALVGPDEELRLPGVEPVPVPNEDEPFVEVLARATDPTELLNQSEAMRFKLPMVPREIIEALLYAPVLNINGLHGGYPAGGKTIIPHVASAVLDLRVPGGVDPDAALRAIVEAVAAVAPEVRVEDVEVLPGSKTPSTAGVARAMISSHADAGTPARVYPTAPWWAPYFLFERTLGLPFAVGGAGHAARAHAADEYASIEGIRQHMKHAVAFLYRFAEAGDG